MRYLVMECHMGYAVVLDEQGAFHKVVNRCYEVGQSVEDVISFETSANDVTNEAQPQEAKKIHWMPVFRAVASVACVCVAMLSVMQNYVVTYGKVHVQINPDIMLSVNKQQYVVGMEALNEDGEALAEGYFYRMKKVDVVLDELAIKATEQGYLESDGEIHVELISDSEEWNTTTKELVEETLDETLEEDVMLTIEAVVETESTAETKDEATTNEEVTDDNTTDKEVLDDAVTDKEVSDDAVIDDNVTDGAVTVPDANTDSSDTNGKEKRQQPMHPDMESQMQPMKPGNGSQVHPRQSEDETRMQEFEEKTEENRPNLREESGRRERRQEKTSEDNEQNSNRGNNNGHTQFERNRTSNKKR